LAQNGKMWEREGLEGDGVKFCHGELEP